MRRILLCALLAFALGCSSSRPGKVRVLLDTDAFNEIDDQFFITYSLAQKDFEIEGINAAQYKWEHGSVDESYYEILKVIELLGVNPAFPIVRGSDVEMKDEKSPVRSPATDLIVQLAKKDDSRPLYVVAVGALTNVGSALVLHPEIKPRVRVIWLWGFAPDNTMNEFNGRNDRAAVKAVFESGVDLTVVPTETSARFLTMPLAQAEARLRHTNVLGKYLLSLLRDYGERQDKVIWDIAATACLRQLVSGNKWFETSREPAPKIDLANARYVRGQGPHTITVMGKPDREAIFEDLFKVIPPSRDQDPPYLLSAVSFGDRKRVSVLFSEPMDQASMMKPECYAAGQAVTAIEKTGEQGATLMLAAPVAAGATVSATCTADRAGNAMLDVRKSVPVRSAVGLEPGLRLSVFRVPSRLREIPAATGSPVYRGTVATVDWPSPLFPAEALPSGSGAALAVAEGSLVVPLDHRYEFSLQSQRLGRVYLGGRLFLDQGVSGDRRVRRTLFLPAGVYPIRIEQYADGTEFNLTLQWNLPFHEVSIIPDSVLFNARP